MEGASDSSECPQSPSNSSGLSKCERAGALAGSFGEESFYLSLLRRTPIPGDLLTGGLRRQCVLVYNVCIVQLDDGVWGN